MIGKRKFVRVGGFNPVDHTVCVGNLVIGRVYQETPDLWTATHQGSRLGLYESEGAATAAVKSAHLNRMYAGPD